MRFRRIPYAFGILGIDFLLPYSRSNHTRDRKEDQGENSHRDLADHEIPIRIGLAVLVRG